MRNKCNECGKLFKEPSTISYQEYPGAKFWDDYVSPCCGAYFDEVD